MFMSEDEYRLLRDAFQAEADRDWMVLQLSGPVGILKVTHEPDQFWSRPHLGRLILGASLSRLYDFVGLL